MLAVRYRGREDVADRIRTNGKGGVVFLDNDKNPVYPTKNGEPMPVSELRSVQIKPEGRDWMYFSQCFIM